MKGEIRRLWRVCGTLVEESVSTAEARAPVPEIVAITPESNGNTATEIVPEVAQSVVPEMESVQAGGTVVCVGTVQEEERPASSACSLAAAAAIPAVERPWPTQRSAISGNDLTVLAARFRLKGEACRWATTRRRLGQQGADFRADIGPRDRELIGRAKEHGCYLWMCNPACPQPDDLGLFEKLAASYDTTAAIASITSSVLSHPDLTRMLRMRCLGAAAEAQLWLYMAIRAVGAKDDSDQREFYYWLREREPTVVWQTVLPASVDAGDFQARIEALADEVEVFQERRKRFDVQLKTIRYHAKLACVNPLDGHNWEKIVGTVETMVQDGVLPSNRELREAILPVIASQPEMDVPDGFRRVRESIENFLATRPLAKSEVVSEPTPAVRKVEEWLKGKRVVLIGGDRRPKAKHKLEKAFGLKELDWISGRGRRQAVEKFDSYIGCPDVLVVLLATRWCSHSLCYAKKYCKKYRKPLVSLPAGYSPDEIARQVLDQCSDRLAAKT